MLKEGVTKFGETPNPDAVAKHLFEDKQAPTLEFLEKHLSPNPLAEQTFTHEQPQQQTQPEHEQPQQQTQPEQEQPQQQPQPQPEQQNEPEVQCAEPDNQNPQHQDSQSLIMDDLIISSEIFIKALEKMVDDTITIDEPKRNLPPVVTPNVLNKIKIKPRTKPANLPKPI
ncbi:hypothetical protein A2U01_0043495, partial [Trifolium medium]|nr:hypothetical protein [Trifolium medium]